MIVCDDHMNRVVHFRSSYKSSVLFWTGLMQETVYSSLESATFMSSKGLLFRKMAAILTSSQ